MIQHPVPTAQLYPHVQHPSAPLLPALPVLDAVVVPNALHCHLCGSSTHTAAGHPFRRQWVTPWYRSKATAVCAGITTAAVVSTVALTLWASAPAPAPAPAPAVAVAAPAPVPVVPPPAPLPTPASAGSSDLGGVAVLGVIAAVCCLFGRGGGKHFDGTFSGRMR
jgi:hypothetical protein